MRANGCRCAALSIFLLLTISAKAKAADDGPCFPPPDAPGIRIDLSTGAIEGDGAEGELALRRRLDDLVTLWFVDANPFAFAYRVDQAETEIVDDDLSRFFPVLRPTGETPTREEDDPGAAPAGDGPVADARLGDPSACTEMRAAVSSLQTANRSAAAVLRELEAKRSRIAEHHSAAAAASTCTRAVEEARQLVAVDLDSAQSGDAMPIALEARSDAVEAANAAVRQQFAAAPGAGCTLPGVVDAARLWLEQGDRMMRALTDAEVRLEELVATQRAVRKVLADPGNFHFRRTLGPYEKATRVEVAVNRRSLAEEQFPDQPLQRLALRFGHQRFYVGTGMAVASLAPQTYEATQGFALDLSGKPVLGDDGQPVFGSVVGLAEDSDERLSYLLALHTWLFAWKRTDVFATVAATDNILDEALNAELLVGISAGWGEKFFLTLGAYRGRVETLQPGFYEGRSLPEDVTTVPVRVGREWGAALALTFAMN